MRKLMWFTIGFTAACAVGIYLVSGARWLLLLAGFCLFAAVGLFFVRTDVAKAVRIVLLGCLLSFCYLTVFDALYIAPARGQDGQRVHASVTITDYSHETNYGVCADGVIEISNRPYKIRVYCAGFVPLAPGDRLDGEFNLRFTASGGAKDPTHHPGKGIFLLAYEQGEAELTEAEKVPARYFAARLRGSILGILDEIFPEDTRGFARALLLGDSSLLSYETDTAFKVSGIRHIVAVSGLHVSILFTAVYTMLGKKSWLTALAGIPVLCLFAAVAGFSPSVVRACIMQVLMILAMLLNQEYDPPTALAFAVLTMLIGNPMTVTAVSFQLSVGCIVGIFLFSSRIRAYILDEKRLGPARGKTIKARLSRWFAGSVSVTLGAMSLTTPLCAAYFGNVSLVGILTNLLTLWLVSFIFYGIMTACIVSLVWLPAAKVIAWVICWMIRLVIYVAEALSQIPFAAVYTCSVYIILWLVASYILLAVFMLCKKKRPFALIGCIAFLLCVCLTCGIVEPKLDNYRVSVLDVGQGQCVLLETNGKIYMVDCGGDYAEAAADAAAHQLLSRGIRRLDGVILTHYDLDHVAGAQLLLERIPAQKIYLPDVEDTSGIKEYFAHKYSDRICWAQPAEIMQLEEIPITLITAQPGKTGNECSICVLFQPENCDILITGDRDRNEELALMEQIELPQLELLIAGHHGSKNATSLELLNATQPETVAICVGRNNNHGHPARELLLRLQVYGCTVWRTDLDGTIIFRG